jgi:uncharacterized protein YqjF (DUF2071 family)
MKPRVFLTANWRHLVLLNYEVDPALLEPHLPRDLALDFWNNKTYVSIVGFSFQRARFFGLPIPFHCNFPEVNLRFYVKREMPAGSRRGVMFLKEIVPRRAVAFVARVVYGEKFLALPMRMTVEEDDRFRGTAQRLRYNWRLGRERYTIAAAASATPHYPEPDTLEEFIIEHYWAYSSANDCVEYEVQHRPWMIRTSREATFSGDAAALYGQEFAGILARPPDSAFLADGSAVSVRRGVCHRSPPQRAVVSKTTKRTARGEPWHNVAARGS